MSIAARITAWTGAGGSAMFSVSALLSFLQWWNSHSGPETRAAAHERGPFDGEVIECSESATCALAAYLSTHKRALVLASPLLPHPPPVLFITHQPLKEATPSDIQSCYACLHINRLLATELWLPAMCLLGA